jgi:hypothetical protein
MLEFFTIAYHANKVSNMKKKENRKIKEMFNGDENVTEYLTKKNINMDAFNFITGIIALIISILSAKLAFNCNAKQGSASQVVALLFGFFFSGFYLLYYFIWHSILGNKC